MDIGGSRWRLTLLQPDLVKDGQGGLKPNLTSVIGGNGDGLGWVTVAKVWGKYLKPNFRELAMTGTILSDLTNQMVIRRRSDVRRGWHVVWNNKTFKVLHVYDPDFETTVMVLQEIER
jgi:head-tail adaptor